MTPKQFYKAHLSSNKSHIEKVATDAGTTFENFKQIAIANGSVSARLAKRLQASSDGEMTLAEILFPDDDDMADASQNS